MLISPNPEHRWTYVAAFIATVFALLKIIDGFEEVFSFLQDIPSAFVALLKIVCAFIYALAYYPIFAAISSKHLFGHLVGFSYTLMMTVIFFIQYRPCSIATKTEIFLTLLMMLPPGFCLIFVTGNFALRIFARFVAKLEFFAKSSNPRTNAMEYVQKMFQK